MGLPDTVLATVWTFFAAATVVMIMRAIACRMRGMFRADFYLASTAWVLGLVANILTTISVSYGTGLHQSELTAENAVVATKWQWIMFYIYVYASTFSKLAIVAFLLEFERSLPAYRKVILYAAGVLVIVVNCGTSILQWVQCTPVEATWDFRITDANCPGRQRNSYGGFLQGATAAALDFFLAIYPMVVFWRLQMDRSIKIGLCALFACGLASAICAILKTIGIAYLVATDATHDLAILDIYSLVELWVAIIVGSIPPTKQLFSRILRGKHPLNSTTNHSKQGYTAQFDSSRNNTRNYTGRGHDKYIVNVSTKPSESEENIILKQEGIMMTRTVAVQDKV